MRNTGAEEPELDIADLPTATPAEAAAVKSEAGLVVPAPGTSAGVFAPAVLLATKPGKERWSVKTGRDEDVGHVKRRIVDATIAGLIALPRPRDMMPPDQLFSAYDTS